MIKSEISNKNEERVLNVTISNGDLQLMESLVDSYSLKDKDALLKFAISAVLQGNNNDGLYIVRKIEENKRILVKVEPSPEMLADKETNPKACD